MSNIIRPAAILLIICLIAAGLLGYVNSITTGPIAEQEAAAQAESMKAVLSDAAEFGESEAIEDDAPEEHDNIDITTITPALDESGEPMGYAVAVTAKGFSAGLQLMFGVDTDGVLTGLSVVNCSNETPGLGANAANESFYSQFAGMSGDIAVTKDGGQVEALTGATITSRAVSNSASRAIEYVSENYPEGGVD